MLCSLSNLFLSLMQFLIFLLTSRTRSLSSFVVVFLSRMRAMISSSSFSFLSFVPAAASFRASAVAAGFLLAAAAASVSELYWRK